MTTIRILNFWGQVKDRSAQNCHSLKAQRIIPKHPVSDIGSFQVCFMKITENYHVKKITMNISPVESPFSQVNSQQKLWNITIFPGILTNFPFFPHFLSTSNIIKWYPWSFHLPGLLPVTHHHRRVAAVASRRRPESRAPRHSPRPSRGGPVRSKFSMDNSYDTIKRYP